MIGFFIISLLMSDGSSGHTWAQGNTHTHTHTHTHAAFPDDETNAI